MTWFRRLFAVPSSEGAAPAPAIPELAPFPGTSAYHQQRAHARGVQVHMAYGRYLIGRPGYKAADVADQAAVVAAEWAAFADRLRDETAPFTVPNSPEELS